MYKLIGTDGSRLYSFNLRNGKYSIGRSKETDFFIQDKTVSRIHAFISYNDNKILITDNGSRNGTRVNDRQIVEETELKLGDVVILGSVEFKISDSDAEQPVVSKSIPLTDNLMNIDREKSVFLSINEALQPLPSKVTDLPDVLPTIFEMAKILVLPEPKEKMLEKALQMVSRVIPAERLAVISHQGDEEVETSAILLPSGKDPGSFNLSKTIIKEILNEKNSILINPQEDERFANQESIIMSEIKSAMAVPLFDEGQVLGILYVDTTNPLHMYTDDYLRLLATFGNLIASRLLNYELLNERQAKQVMEAELHRASSIQNNLLIKSAPEYSGYQIRSFQEQCKMVGGDLFDITLLDDGKLLFLVADVSGKGMGGALLMANILAAFRILYRNESHFDLVKVTKQISKQLHAYSRPEDFATLFIGTIDNTTNELTFLNAGHNPPLLVRANGDIEYLEPSGIMIGAFDFSDWQEEKVTLNPNDSLIVFTDGVVEAERHGELYGDDRLENLVKRCLKLSAEKLIDTIVTDVLDFVADSPRSDDITMIALKRE